MNQKSNHDYGSIRPDMRVHFATTSSIPIPVSSCGGGNSNSNNPSTCYDKPISPEDIVLAPNMFGDESNRTLFFDLREEIAAILSDERCGKRNLEKELSQFKNHFVHVPKAVVRQSKTCNDIVQRVAQYFQLEDNNLGCSLALKQGARGETFRHDLLNLWRNVTITVTFGATREMAFKHALAPAMTSSSPPSECILQEQQQSQEMLQIYLPLSNNSVLCVGRGVNMRWQNGMTTELPDDSCGASNNNHNNNNNNDVTISIIIRGKSKNVVDSPDAVGYNYKDYNNNNNICRDELLVAMEKLQQEQQQQQQKQRQMQHYQPDPKKHYHDDREDTSSLNKNRRDFPSDYSPHHQYHHHQKKETPFPSAGTTTTTSSSTVASLRRARPDPHHHYTPYGDDTDSSRQKDYQQEPPPSSPPPQSRRTSSSSNISRSPYDDYQHDQKRLKIGGRTTDDDAVPLTVNSSRDRHHPSFNDHEHDSFSASTDYNYNKFPHYQYQQQQQQQQQEYEQLQHHPNPSNLPPLPALLPLPPRLPVPPPPPPPRDHQEYYDYHDTLATTTHSCTGAPPTSSLVAVPPSSAWAWTRMDHPAVPAITNRDDNNNNNHAARNNNDNESDSDSDNNDYNNAYNEPHGWAIQSHEAYNFSQTNYSTTTAAASNNNNNNNYKTILKPNRTRGFSVVPRPPTPPLSKKKKKKRVRFSLTNLVEEIDDVETEQQQQQANSNKARAIKLEHPDIVLIDGD